MRRAIVLSIGVALVSVLCVECRSRRLAVDTPSAAQQAPVATPVAPVITAPLESFERPESYFASFDVTKAFAAPTLVRVRDVDRLQRTLTDQIERKLDDVLQKNDPQKLVKQYLDKNEKCSEIETKLNEAQAEYKTKKEAYCAKEKKPEFMALESAATTDVGQRAAFMTLLRKADLKDEWDTVQERRKQVTEATRARNTAWTGLSGGLQSVVLVYQRKQNEVIAAAAKKKAQLQAPAV
jgi:hypothetical protein